MKLNQTPRLQADPSVLRELKEHAYQVNGMAEGKLAAIYNADIAAPTTGLHARGDFIRNSEPSEAGIIGSKYVVFGWLCTVGGEPGTWVQCRFLTGA